MKINKILNNWSKSKNIVIATLIFVYPLGVYLMWKGEHFNKDLRWMISLILVIWTLYLGSNNSDGVIEPSECSASFYQNGCTYYRDSNCQVISQSCD